MIQPNCQMSILYVKSKEICSGDEYITDPSFAEPFLLFREIFDARPKSQILATYRS